MNSRRRGVVAVELLLGVGVGVHASRRGRACCRVHVARWRSWVVGAGVVVDSHCLLGGVAGVVVHPTTRKLMRLAVHGPGVVHDSGGAGGWVVLQVWIQREIHLGTKLVDPLHVGVDGGLRPRARHRLWVGRWEGVGG